MYEPPLPKSGGSTLVHRPYPCERRSFAPGEAGSVAGKDSLLMKRLILAALSAIGIIVAAAPASAGDQWQHNETLVRDA